MCKIIWASVKENSTVLNKAVQTYLSVLQHCFSEIVPKCKLTYGQDYFLMGSLTILKDEMAYISVGTSSMEWSTFPRGAQGFQCSRTYPKLFLLYYFHCIKWEYLWRLSVYLNSYFSFFSSFYVCSLHKCIRYIVIIFIPDYPLVTWLHFWWPLF